MRFGSLFISAGIIRDEAWTGMLRKRVGGARPGERAALLYAIAAATEKEDDVEAFLRALPEDYPTCLELFTPEYYAEGVWKSRMAAFAFRYVESPRLGPLAARKAYLADFFIFLSFREMESSMQGYDKHPAVRAYLDAHKQEIEAITDAWEDRHFSGEEDAVAMWEGLPEDGPNMAGGLREACGHPDPAVRQTALYLAQRYLGLDWEDLPEMMKLVETTPCREERLLLCALLRHEKRPGSENALPSYWDAFLRDFPSSQKDFDAYMQLESAVYPLSGAPSWQGLAFPAGRGPMAPEQREALGRAVEFAGNRLPADAAAMLSRIARGEDVKDEIYLLYQYNETLRVPEN